ncbi:MAG: tetratricopeptide repeat protein [Rickettsiales bacterium]|jgi:hypothetical protein|nr:tetratricopeptide repeat protein [Rickettsiales bacterium]
MTDKEKKSLRERYVETQQSAFIREVNEDVAASRAVEFWNRWRQYIISAIVVALAVTVARSVGQSRRERIMLEQARKFERIMSNPAVSDEGRLLELREFARTARYGYRDIAYFDIHELETKRGDAAAAISTLETIIGGASDESFRNLAVLKLALTKEYTETKDGMENSIRMLAKIKDGRPFRHSALAVLAMLYARRGDFDLADKAVNGLLADDSAPASLKSQAAGIGNYVKSMRAKR